MKMVVEVVEVVEMLEVAMMNVVELMMDVHQVILQLVVVVMVVDAAMETWMTELRVVVLWRLSVVIHPWRME